MITKDSQKESRGFDFWRLLRHRRLTLLRRGYRDNNENRHLAEIMNLIKLMPYIGAQRALQLLRTLRLIRLEP